MAKSSRSQPPARGRPEGREPAAPSARRALVRFVVVFIVTCIALFYAIGAIPWVQTTFFPWYLELNASVSAWVLDRAGEEASTHGTVLATPRFQVDIRRGCDAVAPSALFAAAVIAFPAPLRRKVPGLLGGVAILVVLNVVRIVSLYYTGVHFPNAFQVVHLDVWQPGFILLALVLWLAWAIWSTRDSGKPDVSS